MRGLIVRYRLKLHIALSLVHFIFVLLLIFNESFTLRHTQFQFLFHHRTQHEALKLHRPKFFSSLYSSPLSWEETPFGANNEEKPNNKSNEADNMGLSLLVLNEFSDPTIFTEEELQAKWIDLCIDENTPEDMDNFCLSRIIPHICKDNKLVVIENKTAAILDENGGEEDTIYITEQELESLWKETYGQAFNIKNEDDGFNLLDALLVVDDEDSIQILHNNVDGSSDDNIGSIAPPLLTEISSTGTTNRKDGDAEEDADDEIIISSKELYRLWKERSNFPWGPCNEFDEKNALLLLDTDDDDEKFVTVMEGEALPIGLELEEGQNVYELENEYASAMHEVPFDEKKAFWNKFTGKTNQHLRDTLRRIYEDLEGVETLRPAWKKNRNFLSPDIETQDFMGDIMFSNTYLTQRIPANWEDPEKEEMSDTYLSTGTMAWPGEKETNYNIKRPIWEELNLPFGPDYHPKEDGLHVGPEEVQLEEDCALELHEKDNAVEGDGGNDDLDWNNFDFLSADKTLYGTTAESSPTDDSEVDDFFKSFEDPNQDSTSEDSAETSLLLETMQSLTPEEANKQKRELFNGRDQLKRRFRSWKTPLKWLQRKEFADYVGYEEWSSYGAETFEDADDTVWDDDVYMMQSIQHVMRVTDVYLTDHLEEYRQTEEINNWERKIYELCTGETIGEQEIPKYLTPDIDRGVEYSDEIIEMKGKLSLLPKLRDPKEAFANDTFTHNEDMSFMNKIGTIREQYDWTPRTDLLPYLIEEDKLEKIEPLIRFVNHVATLKSTKDDILVFEYHGIMRHLVGIHSTMTKLAKEHYPNYKDIRLETDRKADKYDF